MKIDNMMIMGRARRQINSDKGFSHVVFRTNNREFYFETDHVKNCIILAAKQYKQKHGIKIIDYCLMSNHCHFTMWYPTVQKLSAFMHDMNLAIARTVNGFYQRRGKAIEDRFRSPVICDFSYCLSAIHYIWLNPVKAHLINVRDAQNYRYCSLFYRYRGLKDPLIDSYADLKALTGFDVLQNSRSEQEFARNQLNALKSKILKQLENLKESIFDHVHTVGSIETIKARLSIFKSFDSS